MKEIIVIKKYFFITPLDKLMIMSAKVDTKGYKCQKEAEILSLSTFYAIEL